MNDAKRKRLYIGIIVISTVAVLINVLIFGRPRTEFPPPPPKPVLIPPGGVPLTKHFDGIPGNPEATAAQMKKIYQKILVFQKQDGCYPQSNGKQFPSDVRENYAEYGFGSYDEARQIFNNPDIWLTDDNVGKKHNSNMIINPYFFPTRPDGSTKCGPKVGAGKDVLMMTDMYVHMNAHINRGDTVTRKPIGFYMVLWDDGTVEQIPWDKARFAKSDTNSGAVAMFEGQYGLDRVETETFSEKYGTKVATK